MANNDVDQVDQNAVAEAPEAPDATPAPEAPAATPEAPVEEASVVTPPPLTTQSLMADVLQSIPGMREVREELEVVATCYVTYLRGPQAVSPQNALMQLGVMRGWTETTIREALDGLMGVVADQLLDLSERFEQETGSEVSAADFSSVEKRYAAEKQEQQDLIKLATRQIQIVGEISALLGIPNPDPALEEAKPKSAKAQQVQRGGFLHRLSEVFIAEQSPPQDADVVLDSSPPPSPVGWETQPVLTTDNPSVMKLMMIDQQRAQFSDPAGLMSWLENMGFSRQQLVELLTEVASLARKQIDQSQQIMDLAGKDFKEFKDELDALQSVRSVIMAVNDFFFSD